MCEKSELILDFVYGELPDGSRRDFEAHLKGCSECREEVAALRRTRGVLASWTPPEPDFGFRIIRESQAPARRRFALTHGWGLAAAAVLVLAAAAAIANVEVRYDGSGLVVRTGWAPSSAAAPPAVSDASIVTTAAPSDDLQSKIAAFEKRLMDLEGRGAHGVQAASGPRIADADLIRQLREMVAESEKRQQRDTILRINQVVEDVDRARRLDYSLYQAALSGQAQQINYALTRASQQK